MRGFFLYVLFFLVVAVVGPLGALALIGGWIGYLYYTRSRDEALVLDELATGPKPEVDLLEVLASQFSSDEENRQFLHQMQVRRLIQPHSDPARPCERWWQLARDGPPRDRWPHRMSERIRKFFEQPQPEFA